MVQRQLECQSRSTCLSQVQCVGRVWQLPWPIHRVSFCGHPVYLLCLGRVWQLPWPVNTVRVSFCGHHVCLQCLGHVWQLPWSVSPQTARYMAQRQLECEWSSCLSSVLGSCASRGTHGHPLLKSTSSGTCHIPVILSLHTLSLNPRGNRHTSGPAGRRNTPASTCIVSPLRRCRGRRTTLTSATMLAVCRGEHH